MKRLLNLKKSFLLSVLSIGFAFIANSQDGKAIFESKCSVCHILGKDATGPNLIGVKAKWEGEEENIYEWVLNPAKLIALGKSERAKVAEQYSATAMPAQNISLDEAKAVIDYVDTYEPPAAASNLPTDALSNVGAGISNSTNGEHVIYVDNYEKNLTIFTVFIFIIIVLLLAIYVVSRSTTALISSEMYREKIAELHNKSKNGGKILTLIMIIGFVGTSQVVSALTFTGPTAAAQELELWAYVTSADINALVIITLLLLAFTLHMINMFYKSLRLIKPKEIKVKADRNPKKGSLAQALQGGVSIEDEYKVDLGHDYDGIRELDNPMPPWWVAGFIISIISAFVYMFHYHIFGTGDLQMAEYNKSVAQAEIDVAAYRKANAMNIDETNATLMEDQSDLMAGKALYLNNCAVCHTEDGHGEVGPNLTDNYWIYGGNIKDVFLVIKKGAPKGMPAHESKLNPIEIEQVASYVLHFDEVSEAKGGKEPQGEIAE